MKKNCWEVKNCGRQPGGAKVEQFGVCPAAISTKLNNYNSGQNGGRACWIIAGTLCGGVVQGSFAMKSNNCMACEFYKQVVLEEGEALTKPTALLKALQ